MIRLELNVRAIENTASSYDSEKHPVGRGNEDAREGGLLK
jgi:hypothetical protein